MGGFAHWFIAVVVTLLTGGLATVVMWQVLRRRDEAAFGIKALAGTSWREFINLVLSALARRGYTRVVDHETASGDAGFTLERDGEHWLLSCKHGSAYALGRHAVDELANDIRLANASGGFLVTQGRILDEARRPASKRSIELLDGQALWPELRDLIKPDTLARIRTSTATLARQRVLLSWLFALLAGVGTFMLLPEPAPKPTRTAPVAAQAQAAPVPEIIAAAPESPLTGEEQRKAVAGAVSTLPMVSHAIWTTQSNLAVYLLDTSGDAMPDICPLVERYPELALSRIQLTPPAGSDAQVRFRQCSGY
ncbi:MAG: restriction endonuclease [Luteimonas sp.]